VINASDMLVIPDPSSAWIDIFNAEPTLSLICTIVEPITREPYNRDPRGVAEKAEAYLQSTGIADTAFFGPEAEFFIFDDVRFSNAGNSSSYSVDSSEGHWNSAREGTASATRSARRGDPAGYRNEMCLELESRDPIERRITK
jgi:glutamine synthetase